jgi:hypothetical protein
MWGEIRRYLRSYSSAVLTGRDAAGRPFSLRCQPEIDEQEQVLHLRLPTTAELVKGPASILCHSHNLFLWNLRSFLVRGTVEPVGESWLFRPAQFVPGIGVGGVPGMIRFATSKRRTANQYLAQRGLARPRIPWAQLRAIQKDSLRHRD